MEVLGTYGSCRDIKGGKEENDIIALKWIGNEKKDLRPGQNSCQIGGTLHEDQL